MHINVEICSTIEAIKYLYKYIYKGHDWVAFNISYQENLENIDEIKNFQVIRRISPPKVMWRIYSLSLNEIHPFVKTLQLYLENKQSVIFRKLGNLDSIINNDSF